MLVGFLACADSRPLAGKHGLRAVDAGPFDHRLFRTAGSRHSLLGRPVRDAISGAERREERQPHSKHGLSDSRGRRGARLPEHPGHGDFFLRRVPDRAAICLGGSHSVTDYRAQHEPDPALRGVQLCTHRARTLRRGQRRHDLGGADQGCAGRVVPAARVWPRRSGSHLPCHHAGPVRGDGRVCEGPLPAVESQHPGCGLGRLQGAFRLQHLSLHVDRRQSTDFLLRCRGDRNFPGGGSDHSLRDCRIVDQLRAERRFAGHRYRCIPPPREWMRQRISPGSSAC